MIDHLYLSVHCISAIFDLLLEPMYRSNYVCVSISYNPVGIYYILQWLFSDILVSFYTVHELIYE